MRALPLESLTPPQGTRPRTVRNRRLLAVGLTLGALCAVLLLLGQAWLFHRLAWPQRAEPGAVEFGINFSCDYAEYLLLEDPALGPAGYVDDARPDRPAWCAGVLADLLRETGARYVRISAEWEEVEPAPGRFDYRVLDALLAAADGQGARVMLSVGVKAQRHPEFYIPGWVTERAALLPDSDIARDPFLRERALAMVRSVVEHTAASPAIDSWLADNEPYQESGRAEGWVLGRDFVREEVAAIRESDPRGRPVAINTSERLTLPRRWLWSLEDADIVAISTYPARIIEAPLKHFILDIIQLGPLTPNYPARAKETRERGKAFWITELQAEPWGKPDVRLVSPTQPALDMTPARFRKNVDYARRSGATRAYLWGAEWWLFQERRYGDGEWLEMARDALSGGPTLHR